jgi:hypothetical protein
MSDKKSAHPIPPGYLAEADAAEFLAESHELRRKNRYKDKQRLARGEPIEGPPWVEDGGRIKYRMSDLDRYVDARGNVLTAASTECAQARARR